jgi:serine protease AprX
MLNNSIKKITKPLSLLGAIGLSVWFVSLLLNTTTNTKAQSYIITAADYSLLKENVKELNLVPSHELAIINAIAVDLSQSQLTQLQKSLSIKVTKNHKVELSSGRAWGKRKWQPKATVPKYIGAE